jgi:hypothetical protein
MRERERERERERKREERDRQRGGEREETAKSSGFSFLTFEVEDFSLTTALFGKAMLASCVLWRLSVVVLTPAATGAGAGLPGFHTCPDSAALRLAR